MSESLLLTVRNMAQPVSWFLIHSLWQGGLVAIVLAAVLSLLRHRSPQMRYALAIVTLLLIMPLSVSTVGYDLVSRQLASEVVTVGGSVSAATNQAQAQSNTDAAAESGFLTEIRSVGVSRQNAAMFWVVLVWLLGIGVITLYHLLGWSQARRLIRLGTTPVLSQWQVRFDRLRQRTGIVRGVRILRSSLVKVPCVVGWIKPTVLVPVSAFTGLSVTELEMVLAHELAHVRRHDVLVNYLQTTIETILFFNPAVWWISRQIRVEREHCCDDFAVDICGDRVTYARALTNLEGMRTWRPRLALSAAGTPLLKRVRRLVEAAGNNRRRWRLNAVSVLILLAVLTIGFSISTAFTPQNDPAVPTNTAITYEEQDDDMHGYWEIEPKDKRVMLTMAFDRRGGRTTSSYYLDEFTGFREGDDVQFQLIRDAGTFFLEGDVENDDSEYWGEGECHFRASDEFIEKMSDFGYRIRSTRDAWELAIHNVTIDFAKGINDAGYDRLSLDRLVEMHIHRATPEFINGLAGLGYRGLSVSKLIEMRIHRATVEYIKELQKLGYTNLDPSKLVEMRIHNVDPEYIRRLAEQGLKDISPSKLVEMSIHRVTPDYVARLKDLGYDNLKPNKLVEMSIHRVDPDYVRRLGELGLKDISPSKLVEMRIHNVEPYYVESLIKLGYDNLDPSDLVAMRIHDVGPSFIEDLQERGYDDLSPDELIEFKIHGYDRRARSRDD